MKIIAKWLDKEGDIFLQYDKPGWYNYIFNDNPMKNPSPTYLRDSHNDIKNCKLIWASFNTYLKKIK